MSADCIFCKIVRGELPAHKVYEDATSFAFLDIRPLADGHTMVIPKAHYERLQDVPIAEAGRLFEAVHKVAGAVQSALDAPATTIGINNGKAAGQVVPHLHIHIVPRHAHDGGGTIHSILRGSSRRGLDEVRELMTSALEGPS
jgi:histidine triad (HIT) family protein